MPRVRFVSTMGAGKNKSHRKKRISKHVLQAEERRKQAEVEKQLLSAAERTSTSTSDDTSKSNHKPISSESQKIESTIPPPTNTRYPELASSYLTLWSHDQKNNTKSWKFNKNTQSWLLRHMYDFDKVSKTTFAILVDYICQGGEGLISRVEEDAKMRARRYKEWEKKMMMKKSSEQQEGEEGDDATNNKVEDGDSKDTNQKKQSSSDDISWDELDDHDKRKEYKRARKVLDSVKSIMEARPDL